MEEGNWEEIPVDPIIINTCSNQRCYVYVYPNSKHHTWREFYSNTIEEMALKVVQYIIESRSQGDNLSEEFVFNKLFKSSTEKVKFKLLAVRTMKDSRAPMRPEYITSMVNELNLRMGYNFFVVKKLEETKTISNDKAIELKLQIVKNIINQEESPKDEDVSELENNNAVKKVKEFRMASEDDIKSIERQILDKIEEGKRKYIRGHETLFDSGMLTFHESSRNEKCIIIMKPDAVKRLLHFKILNMIQDKGFALFRMKYADHITKDDLKRFYYAHTGKPWFDKHINFMASGPVVIAIFYGYEICKKMETYKLEIRAKYSNDVTENVIHCSDNQLAAYWEYLAIQEYIL